MTHEEIVARLESMTKTQLISLRRRLFGGVGDTSKDSRSYCRRILDGADDATISNMLDIMEHGEAVPETPARAHVPTKSTPPAPDAEKTAEALLIGAIRTIAGTVNQKQTIDINTIEKIVRDAVSDAIRDHRHVIPIPDMIQLPGKPEKLVHEQFEAVLKRVACNVPVLLAGPAGSGKTQIAHDIASLLQLPFGMLSCTGGMSESHLLGYLLPQSDGSIAYVASRFVEIYRDGGVFLLDELDAADPNILLAINGALANGSIHIPYARTSFPKHENFRLIATANTLGHGSTKAYTSRAKLDAATLDRFRAGIVQIDYSRTLESALIDATILGTGQRIRDVIKNNRLPYLLSTRTLIDWSTLTQNGITMKECLAAYFADWSTDHAHLAAIKGAH